MNRNRNRLLLSAGLLASVLALLRLGEQAQGAWNGAAAAMPAAAAQKARPDRFTGGKQAFLQIKDELLKRYYDDGLTEDDMYRAAAEGMLERVDPAMGRWNKLLSPSEIAELRGAIQGVVVGIGVELKFDTDSGLADIVRVLPASPALKAGIVAGDKIVTVNGKLYKGQVIGDVVADLRGKLGDSVTLTLLHGASLVTRQVLRERIAYGTVTGELLPGGVGYVDISSFSETAPALLRARLGALRQEGMRALVVDVRGNQGGLFDAAVECAGMLLPAGTAVVKVVHRGGKQDTRLAKGEPVVTGMPVAVLVDGATSSGAELFAGALQEGLSAPVIGSKTLGKWSAQWMEELPNHYAYKFTFSLFLTPSGKSYNGKGLAPDVEVSMEEDAIGAAQRLSSPTEHLAADVQLRTAANLLMLRSRR